jgi:hypothetical protein
MSSGFYAWHSHGTELRRLRCVGKKVLERLAHRELSVAVAWWKFQSSKQRRAEMITSRILNHWTHRTHAAAFDRWHEQAAEQRRMQDICAKITAHLLNHSLGLAFESWREHAKNQGIEQDITSLIPMLEGVGSSFDSMACRFVEKSSVSRINFIMRTVIRWQQRTVSLHAFALMHKQHANRICIHVPTCANAHADAHICISGGLVFRRLEALGQDTPETSHLLLTHAAALASSWASTGI